ncbi:MAG: NUDIX domain-containing protein [Patescibacteria group bacterium]
MPKPSNPEKWEYMFSDDMTFSQKIVISNPELVNRFLILKRSSISTNPGLWDLPGGNVLYGELHQDSLARELLEETGLTDIQELKPAIVNTRYIPEKMLYRLYIGYKAKTLGTKIILSSEHDDFQWVTLEEVLNMPAKDMLKEMTRQSLIN